MEGKKDMEAIIGTRGSLLAVTQATWVKKELEKNFTGLKINLKKIKTMGDKILDVPLAKVGGKGLFVKEIEDALLRGEVDIAVHSMKDLPADIPQGLIISAVTFREDPSDVLISRDGKGLSELPVEARIGTSSLRRISQLLHFRTDLMMIQLRGNLDTRLKKLDKGDVDAIILAAAGVKRMGWESRITEYITHDISLPATGQGALGIETRESDTTINGMVARLNHPETSRCVTAERTFLGKLQGGCQVPIAALARIEGDQMVMEGLVASIDGKRLVRQRISGNQMEHEKLGLLLAERLLSLGADRILKEIYG
ncbi:MAG: hydroxymethylbilane synthase [Nitrospirota bacterium]